MFKNIGFEDDEDSVLKKPDFRKKGCVEVKSLSKNAANFLLLFY